MYGVVCFRWDGDFDHSVAFTTESEARAYCLAQSGDGCRYEVWHNGVRLG